MLGKRMKTYEYKIRSISEYLFRKKKKVTRNVKFLKWHWCHKIQNNRQLRNIWPSIRNALFIFMGIATASSYLLALVWGSEKGGPSLCTYVWRDVRGSLERGLGRQDHRGCFCLFCWWVQRSGDDCRGCSCFGVTWQPWPGACLPVDVAASLSPEVAQQHARLPSFPWEVSFQMPCSLWPKKALIRLPLTKAVELYTFCLHLHVGTIKDLLLKQALKTRWAK